MLPPASWGTGWDLLLDTGQDAARPFACGAGDSIHVPGRAVLVLRLQHADSAGD